MKTEIKDEEEILIIGNPNKTYKSFGDQLLDDQDFRNWAISYGKLKDSRKEIESYLSMMFDRFGDEYTKHAIRTIKLIAIPIDLTTNEKITMEIE